MISGGGYNYKETTSRGMKTFVMAELSMAWKTLGH